MIMRERPPAFYKELIEAIEGLLKVHSHRLYDREDLLSREFRNDQSIVERARSILVKARIKENIL